MMIRADAFNGPHRSVYSAYKFRDTGIYAAIAADYYPECSDGAIRRSDPGGFSAAAPGLYTFLTRSTPTVTAGSTAKTASRAMLIRTSTARSVRRPNWSSPSSCSFSSSRTACTGGSTSDRTGALPIPTI